MKLQAFNSTCVRGYSDFEDNGIKHYLLFQPICEYFKKIANSNHISAWKSKELFYESIKSPAAFNNSLTPASNFVNAKTRVNSNEGYLKRVLLNPPTTNQPTTDHLPTDPPTH